MASEFCNVRVLIVSIAAIFILIQIRLFTTQSRHADRLAAQESRYFRVRSMPLIQDFTMGLQQRSLDVIKEPFSAVVIMACNRPDYLERTIKSILKYHTSVASRFPIFVSQDGTNPDVKSKALSYSQIRHMQHLDLETVQTDRPGEIVAYYKIAKHYKWALDELLLKKNFSRVIILEDDMEIAPDFFGYFEATATLLDNDKSIMAISSWNDNGQSQFVQDPEALYRSDFFPGLGWMLTRSTWLELSPKWPKAYWDDWLRLKDVHKNRQFIRPEICRTYNFGEHGSSMGQFFKQYLEPIKLNDFHVDWKKMDLSYLLEDGIPRTAYKGVVVFRYKTSRRIFLVGPDSLRQLGIKSF